MGRLFTDESRKVIAGLRKISQTFAEKTPIESVLLTGSAARGEYTENSDVDIILVTEKHNIIFKEMFVARLERSFPSVEWDVGLYSFDRLKKEKSFLLFETKREGSVLAGRDVLSEMPDISLQDLFPFEVFRILLNRGILVLKATIRADMESDSGAPRAFRRMDQTIERVTQVFAHLSSDITISKWNRTSHTDQFSAFKDVRKIFINIIQKGLKLAHYQSFEDFLQDMEKSFKYPLAFRAKTLLCTSKPSSIFKNPIFEVYEREYEFFRRRLQPSLHSDVIERLVDIWKDSPQPLIPKV